MEELRDHEFAYGSALPQAAAFFLTPFTSSVSPTARCLSSCYTRVGAPVRVKRQLEWVSLHGRLVEDEEATAVGRIDRNGGFRDREAAEWEMCTPIERVLVVAIVAAAAINSKKNRQIFQLRKSVEIRDQMLQSMEQKMYSLFQQVNDYNNQPATKRTDGGCEPCQRHMIPSKHALGTTSMKGSNGDELLEYEVPVSDVVEAEEHRMSDLSDWAPSVASSVDNKCETGATDNDITDLMEKSKQNDVAINQLSAFIQSSNKYGSKRNADLEYVISRKNTIIDKLQKDIIILEQKVMGLTRVRKPSLLAASSNAKQLPFMADNVLYDMDSATGSSSDSDSSPRNQILGPSLESQEVHIQICKKTSRVSSKCRKFSRRSLVTSPPKESSISQTPKSAPSMKPRSSPGAENRTRRRLPARSREAAASRRWL